jgi:hypothetical protein
MIRRRALRYFRPGVTWTVVGLGILAALVAVYGVARAHARIEADQLRRELCAERLRSLQARNPFVEKFLRPADACLALQVVRGER